MRDIKFRCWDTENKEMLDIQELDYRDSYNGQPMIRTTMYRDYFDTEDMILMQYTGLKDKNGKEIYEGDIVEIKGYSNKGYNTGLVKEIYVVEFKDFCWSCGTKSLLNLATINWASIEVIGNIYANSELLVERE